MDELFTEEAAQEARELANEMPLDILQSTIEEIDLEMTKVDGGAYYASWMVSVTRGALMAELCFKLPSYKA